MHFCKKGFVLLHISGSQLNELLLRFYSLGDGRGG